MQVFVAAHRTKGGMHAAMLDVADEVVPEVVELDKVAAEVVDSRVDVEMSAREDTESDEDDDKEEFEEDDTGVDEEGDADEVEDEVRKVDEDEDDTSEVNADEEFEEADTEVYEEGDVDEIEDEVTEVEVEEEEYEDEDEDEDDTSEEDAAEELEDDAELLGGGVSDGADFDVDNELVIESGISLGGLDVEIGKAEPVIVTSVIPAQAQTLEYSAASTQNGVAYSGIVLLLAVLHTVNFFLLK